MGCIKLFIPTIISKISSFNAFYRILIIWLASFSCEFLYIWKTIILRLAKNKALHRTLYAITAGNVNENKAGTGLTVLTERESKIKSLFAHDLGCYHNLDKKVIILITLIDIPLKK